jgi:hypothetical protein
VIIHSTFYKHLNNWEYNEAVHQLFIDFKKANVSVNSEVFHNILKESGIPMKPLRLINLWLNETYSRVQVSKHLPNMFHVMNGFQ